MIQTRRKLNFSLIDASDTIGNMSFWLKDGVDVAAAESAAATLRPLVEACTKVVLIRQGIVFPAIEVPAPEPAGDADGNRVGGLIFSCDTGELDIVEIHGLKSDMVLATGAGAGLLIDRTNPAIADLVTELTSGFWCNPFGFTLETLESAYLQIRR